MDEDELRDKLTGIVTWLDTQPYDIRKNETYEAALAYCAVWFSEEADKIKEQED